MTGTSSQSNNPTDPVVITDAGGPITIDGTVALSNQFDDEWWILCDTVGSFARRYRTDSLGAVTVTNLTLGGAPYVPVGAVGACSDVVSNFPSDREIVILCDTVTSFLRRYNITSAGVVTITDTTLNGATPYVPVGAVGVCSAPATVTNRRDVFAEVLCDTVTQFLRRYTVNDAGVVSIVNTTLDGTTAYVPVGAISRCAGNVRTDEIQVMADSAGPFLRRLSWDAAGVLTVTNLTLAGAAYVPVGTVTFSGGRNVSAITVTHLSGVSSVVSSATARRVTFIYGNNDTTAANRPSINGVSTLISPNGTAEQINTLVFGDLATGGFVVPITFAVNEAGDSANVIQEF